MININEENTKFAKKNFFIYNFPKYIGLKSGIDFVGNTSPIILDIVYKQK